MAAMFTTQAIYYVNTVGMDPLQLVLVGTLLEATCFVFEVPTGVVADTYSRRLSVIIGVFLLGIGFALEGLLPFFWAILTAQVVTGVGYTFTSGARQAWLADEVGDENVGPVFLRASQVGRAGAFAGILLGVGLASIWINLTLIVGGLLLISLGVILLFVMQEHGFKPAPREERTTWQSMRGTFTDGLKMVRGRPVLMTLLAVELFAGMASEGFDRLGEAHLLTNFQFPSLGELQLTPVIWFGIIEIAMLLLGIVGTEIVKRRVNTNDHRVVARLLIAFSVVRIAAVVAFGLAWGFPMAVATYLVARVFMGMSYPLYDAWLTQSIDSRVRATVLSMHSQVNAFGQIGGGPVIGWIGNTSGIRAAIVATGLLLTPTLPLYASTLRRRKNVQAVHEVEAVVTTQ
jgi:DHA3 family tetracycline resistance protein-like MFS transporter